jgi:thiol-disulfide isomerase/thioredoxin
MQYRCFLALTFFAAVLPAQPVRTEADAQALEARVESNPNDAAARAQLIFFYGRSRPAAMTAETVRPLRRNHILWMIENHPEHPALGDGAGIIDKTGTPLADPDAWTEADLAWKRALAQPSRAEVYAHAIAFYRISDPAFALDVANRGLAAFPHHERIATAKGLLLAAIILGIRNLDQFGHATSFDDDLAKGKDAAAARKELESTSEAAFAAGAAQAFSMQQFALTSHRRTKEAADATEFAERLNRRAVELDPDNPRWKSQLATSYWMQASSKRTPAEKIELIEKALPLADNNLRLYVMPDLAKAYFDAGNNPMAKEAAEATLDFAERNKSGPNYAGAVHNANVVLGRTALKDKNVDEAKTRLLAAGHVSSTPVLGSFGPDWYLARDLLGKGERDTVLAYIDLCRNFWTSGKARLDSWASTIRAGGSPNFFGSPEISGTQLVGKPAPEFRLKKLGGGEISLADLKGKVVILDFWATWCSPCRAEMPEFEKLHKQLSAKDVAIIAVDADEAADTVAEFIEKEKYTLPVVLTEGTDVIKQYGIHAYPTTLALDRTGRVAEELVGNSSDAGSRLRAAIDRARNGVSEAPASTTLVAPRLISPAPGAVFEHYPRYTTVVWSEVPGAASYRVEWAYESAGAWSDPSPAVSVKEPVANFSFVGAQTGRWRVWAVDVSGHEGPKSDWREFRYTR